MAAARITALSGVVLALSACPRASAPSGASTPEPTRQGRIITPTPFPTSADEDEAAYQHAIERGTATSYWSYVHGYASGKTTRKPRHFEEVERRLDDLLFAEATAANHSHDYEVYIHAEDRYAGIQRRHKSEARLHLAEVFEGEVRRYFDNAGLRRDSDPMFVAGMQSLMEYVAAEAPRRRICVVRADRTEFDPVAVVVAARRDARGARVEALRLSDARARRIEASLSAGFQRGLERLVDRLTLAAMECKVPDPELPHIEYGFAWTYAGTVYDPPPPPVRTRAQRPGYPGAPTPTPTPRPTPRAEGLVYAGVRLTMEITLHVPARRESNSPRPAVEVPLRLSTAPPIVDGHVHLVGRDLERRIESELWDLALARMGMAEIDLDQRR